MKRILRLFLVALILTLGYCSLIGASSGKITISVTLTTSASIWIGSSSYDYQSLAANATSISATSIAVRNNSTALITKWELSGAVTTGTNPVSLQAWDGTSSLTDNQIGLQGLFNSNMPSDGDFTSGGTKDTLTGTAKIFDDTNNYFTGAAGDENADNTANGGINVSNEKHLWFRIKMPPAMTNPAQTLDVSITASAI